MKPCRLGRPTGSIILFPNDEHVVIDCVLRILKIQHAIANFNFNATGSSSCLETLCHVVYILGITRNKVSGMPVIFVSF